ncbi:MAG: VCBS repeat-containing protein, partial [Flavobacteriales bacterium]|nr:VCBS repeat-containing protein [Flavobacteriales bacterium]
MRTTWIVLANLVLPLVLRAQYGPPEVIRGNLPQINSVSESKFFDIDLDGHLDMVCASTDSVFWFKGDGADHYGPGRIALSGLAFARSLDYGDVNGDGVDDLVVAQGSNGGIVRGLNNGFGEFEFVAPEIPNIGGVIFVQLADLNGDGHNDIVWLGQGRISSFMNDGLGNFGEPQVITGTTVLTNEFTLGDVDQDGDIDVIFNREAVTWYANDGTGQFSAVEALGVWGIGTHVELVDLNGDTRPDVVFTTAFGDLVYRPATGGGSFDPELILEDGIGTGNVRAADLDADGDQDLVLAAADSVWVLLNDGTANFTRSSNGLASVVNIFLQDLTGDGAKDLVYNPWNSTDMAYLANIGGGEFRSRPVKVPYREGVGTIRPVDIDADGDMDLITRGDLMVSLFTQQPDGFFVDSAMYFGEEPMGNFDLQDIDQDGALDLLFYTGVEYAATLYWKRNLGNGQFGPEVLLATDHNGRFTQLDVDGDGDLDHVVGYPDLGWRRNDGTSFSGHITIDAAATIVYTTESADLNGDGLQDILLLHENSNISWYRNLGNGLFAPRVGLGAFAFGPEVHPADLDQDGDLDLVIAFASVDVAVLMNDGNGVFGPAEMLVVQLALNGTILVVDVDGDGDLDILNGRRMAFNYLPNDGTGQFGEEIVLFPDDQFVEIYGLVPADVDRNGLLDFVYVRSNGYQFEWMPNRSDAYHRIEGRMFFDADADG